MYHKVGEVWEARSVKTRLTSEVIVIPDFERGSPWLWGRLSWLYKRSLPSCQTTWWWGNSYDDGGDNTGDVRRRPVGVDT